MKQYENMILASSSPRRHQLLGLGGWNFIVQTAEIDETPNNTEDPKEYVVRLAEEKAHAIGDTSALVIAADTTVADGQAILGKPTDAQDARTMLTNLRGRTHQVFTGIAISLNGETLTELAATDVPMRDYTDQEIEDYIETGDPFDKAGSYAIQHPGFKPVENLTGCYANVVGLPLCHLTRTLAKLDIAPQQDIPQACQQTLNYTCTVYNEVLKGTS